MKLTALALESHLLLNYSYFRQFLLHLKNLGIVAFSYAENYVDGSGHKSFSVAFALLSDVMELSYGLEASLGAKETLTSHGFSLSYAIQ